MVLEVIADDLRFGPLDARYSTCWHDAKFKSYSGPWDRMLTPGTSGAYYRDGKST
jgi:hypothetical protein